MFIKYLSSKWKYKNKLNFYIIRPIPEAGVSICNQQTALCGWVIVRGRKLAGQRDSPGAVHQQ